MEWFLLSIGYREVSDGLWACKDSVKPVPLKDAYEYEMEIFK
jgi:hypothetical protein